MFDECPRHHSRTAFVLILVCALILVAFSPNAIAQSVNCAGVPAWVANTSYGIGQLVTYSNVEYKCLQGHTSEVGWEPPNTPALWQQMGSCSTSVTPTPKPTATATPKATGTATPKPTASPTPKATATPKPTVTPTPKPTATPTPVLTGCVVGSTVSFASKANGLYVTADTRLTNAPLLAETSTAQAWEEYDIVDAGGGWIALKAHSNGFYVSADLSASGALEAGWATTIQAWEEFQLSTTSDGYVALKANANGFYVSANLGATNSPLTAGWATTVQDWEKFTCTPVGGGTASGPRQKLLNFIGSISGRQTMAGEHNRESSEGNFIQTMDNITGDYPALWGGDFLYESDQIANRQNMIAYEISGGKGGALISLMYHACPPTQSESCGWQGGVLSSLTDAQWSDLTTDGGQLNGVWKSRLDSIAPYFQQIQSAGLPVLFRPFHEMNQGVFWWAGRQGPNGTAKLYQLTHDYFTNHWGLNNIVWVWSMQDIWDGSTNSYDFSQYDPGSAYWDVMSLDFYDGAGFTTAKYNMMTSYAGSKPIAIGECQVLPTPSELAAQPRWIYFMGWAELIQQNESNAAIQSTYWGPSVLTENGNSKMPGW